MADIKSIARRIPGIYPIYRFIKFLHHARRGSAHEMFDAYPAGHFHSPLPDLKEILSKEEPVFALAGRELPGLELREPDQLNLLNTISAYYKELPFAETASKSQRYYYRNDYFSYGDAIVLFGMMRHFKPKRIIEIGSGFSSGAMLDTSDLFLNGAVDFTFIEPHPERLQTLLKSQDDCQSLVLQRPVQEVELSLFERLEENDFLFVDSSHVVKIGSDVGHILFHILPKLKAGVIIHFHDILWPFEYPKEWIQSGRIWNEAYFLRAFLQFNQAFQFLYFNSFMALFHAELVAQKMPLAVQNTGGSLWIQKSI